MAKFAHSVLFLAAALCFVSAVSCEDFKVHGLVYCDTCLAGFETIVSEYIPGANVTLECRDRVGGHVTYTANSVTDKTGGYTILVDGDHEEEVCEVLLNESPRSDCTRKIPGRSVGRVAITANNGIKEPVRFVNSIGYLKDAPIEICPEIISSYGLTPKDIMI